MKTGVLGPLFILLMTTINASPFTLADPPMQPATNPVIWADVPDIAIIRVGDTYYMSSTTMHMCPGLPIMKSRDLVNWELVNYAYDILADNDALSLKNGKNAYGAGSWASSLRYHDGLFYVTTFSSSTHKTHVFTTKDIEHGPWKAVSFSPMLHDHSLFFDDDGRTYMVHGSNNLRLTELTADASAVKPGGFDAVVIPDASHVAGGRVGLGAEGSQMFKVDGRYYVCNITWPKGDMRTQIIHRADRITGPYEGRVILHDRGIAQGGLIDTPDGKWYAYLFRDCGAVGRCPYLVPMKWVDGWPVLGEDGKAPKTLDIPAVSGGAGGLGNIVASDEFERSPEMMNELKRTKRGENDYVRSAFPLAWQWNHNPDNRYWSLTDRPGYLRLTTGRVDATLPDARNSLTQRTFGPVSSANTAVDVSAMKVGDVAGLAAFQKHYGFVGVKMTDAGKCIVMVSAEGDAPEQIESIPLTQDTVYLKADGDFSKPPELALFYYSLDDEHWTPIGKPLHMRYTLPHFMGYRFALFNFATQTPGGHADFDYYRISDTIEPHP